MPDIQKNLISVYRLCNTNQVLVKFSPASFQVKDLSTRAPLLQDRTRSELYEWYMSAAQARVFSASDRIKTICDVWHLRLGHPSLPLLQSIITKNSLHVAATSLEFQKPFFCSDCHNKSHKMPFHQTSIASIRPLQYVFSDVWSSPILFTDNNKYYVIFVDHFSRYTWLYLIQKKSQVKEVFLAFKPLVENHFQVKIGTIFYDNGGEYVALRSYLQTHGISHLTFPPHTPKHNGLSKQKHMHIVETGMSLLSAASISKSYWFYAFETTVYLINRLPTPVLVNQSHYLGQTPNYEKPWTFGCRCYPWLRPYATHKLDDQSTPCEFMGYSLTQSAYYCLDIDTGRLYTSRHAQFDEFIFPSSSHTDHAKVQQSEEAQSKRSIPFAKVHLVQPSVPPSLGPHQSATPTASATTPSQV